MQGKLWTDSSSSSSSWWAAWGLPSTGHLDHTSTRVSLPQPLPVLTPALYWAGRAAQSWQTSLLRALAAPPFLASTGAVAAPVPPPTLAWAGPRQPRDSPHGSCSVLCFLRSCCCRGKSRAVGSACPEPRAPWAGGCNAKAAATLPFEVIRFSA